MLWQYQPRIVLYVYSETMIPYYYWLMFSREHSIGYQCKLLRSICSHHGNRKYKLLWPLGYCRTALSRHSCHGPSYKSSGCSGCGLEHKSWCFTTGTSLWYISTYHILSLHSFYLPSQQLILVKALLPQSAYWPEVHTPNIIFWSGQVRYTPSAPCCVVQPYFSSSAFRLNSLQHLRMVQ